MADTKEVAVKRKVRAILGKYGAYYFSYVVTGWGSGKGVPDIITCYKGRFIGIECKAGTNKSTPLQLINLNLITEAGGVALVINETNLDTLTKTLDNIDQQTKV